MMRKLITMLCGLVLLTIVSQAGAVIMSLEPSSQTAGPGETISLDLIIDGLGDFASDSLGDFDVDVGYDPGALSFIGYNLGPFLGDPNLGEAIDFSLGDLGGIVNLIELSLLLPFELDALQPGSFSLATLEFMVDVLSPGSSTTVAIDTVYALGDGFGLPLPLDATSPAVISNPVPEPTILALLSLGLAGLGYTRRKMKV